MSTLRITEIGSFQGYWEAALATIHDQMAEGESGPFKIAINVTIERKGVTGKGDDVIMAKASLKVKGPSPETLTSGAKMLARENGSFVGVPDKQTDLGLGA